VGHVIVGMDPHKRSATIEVIDAREKVLAQGRFGTGQDGYKMMLAAGRGFPDRTRAAGGCGGIGRHLAQRLIADGETVVDVPAKLSARARVFATGQGRKSDPADAHSVAVAALRTDGLQVVAADGETVALRLLADRRDGLGHARTDTVNRLHRLLLELLPGGAKKFLSAQQARALLAAVRPRDIAGRTRRQLASELAATGQEDQGCEHPADRAGCRHRQRLARDLTGSARPALPASWATSGTSAASLTAATSRPGTALPRSRHPPASRSGIGYHGPGTGASTGSCTSWPSPAAQRHRRPRLLPPQARRWQDQHGSHPVSQTTAIRCRLPPDDQ
jgi:hypothetical protein